MHDERACVGLAGNKDRPKKQGAYPWPLASETPPAGSERAAARRSAAVAGTSIVSSCWLDRWIITERQPEPTVGASAATMRSSLTEPKDTPVRQRRRAVQIISLRSVTPMIMRGANGKPDLTLAAWVCLRQAARCAAIISGISGGRTTSPPEP